MSFHFFITFFKDTMLVKLLLCLMPAILFSLKIMDVKAILPRKAGKMLETIGPVKEGELGTMPEALFIGPVKEEPGVCGIDTCEKAKQGIKKMDPSPLTNAKQFLPFAQSIGDNLLNLEEGSKKLEDHWRALFHVTISLTNRQRRILAQDYCRRMYSISDDNMKTDVNFSKECLGRMFTGGRNGLRQLSKIFSKWKSLRQLNMPKKLHRLIEALFEPPLVVEAKELHRELTSPSSMVVCMDFIFELFFTRTNKEISEIKEIYQQLFGVPLATHLRGLAKRKVLKIKYMKREMEESSKTVLEEGKKKEEKKTHAKCWPKFDIKNILTKKGKEKDAQRKGGIRGKNGNKVQNVEIADVPVATHEQSPRINPSEDGRSQIPLLREPKFSLSDRLPIAVHSIASTGGGTLSEGNSPRSSSPIHGRGGYDEERKEMPKMEKLKEKVEQQNERQMEMEQKRREEGSVWWEAERKRKGKAIEGEIVEEAKVDEVEIRSEDKREIWKEQEEMSQMSQIEKAEENEMEKKLKNDFEAKKLEEEKRIREMKKQIEWGKYKWQWEWTMVRRANMGMDSKLLLLHIANQLARQSVDGPMIGSLLRFLNTNSLDAQTNVLINNIFDMMGKNNIDGKIGIDGRKVQEYFAARIIFALEEAAGRKKDYAELTRLLVGRAELDLRSIAKRLNRNGEKAELVEALIAKLDDKEYAEAVGNLLFVIKYADKGNEKRKEEMLFTNGWYEQLCGGRRKERLCELEESFRPKRLQKQIKFAWQTLGRAAIAEHVLQMPSEEEKKACDEFLYLLDVERQTALVPMCIPSWLDHLYKKAEDVCGKDFLENHQERQGWRQEIMDTCALADELFEGRRGQMEWDHSEEVQTEIGDDENGDGFHTPVDSFLTLKEQLQFAWHTVGKRTIEQFVKEVPLKEAKEECEEFLHMLDIGRPFAKKEQHQQMMTCIVPWLDHLYKKAEKVCGKYFLIDQLAREEWHQSVKDTCEWADRIFEKLKGWQMARHNGEESDTDGDGFHTPVGELADKEEERDLPSSTNTD